MKKYAEIKRKKKLTIALAIMMVLLLTGCSDTDSTMLYGNKQLIDTTYTYERAILSLPNGEIIEGKVKSWTDFKDGDQIQVNIDGKQYLVHSENIVLISEY